MCLKQVMRRLFYSVHFLAATSPPLLGFAYKYWDAHIVCRLLINGLSNDRTIDALISIGP